MSGKKQHFIPQVLLRGFGIPRNKKTYVYVFPYERPTFEVATDGVGAARYFYSKLSEDSDEKTLDDKITDYENNQKAILLKLREQPKNETIDGAAVAELVTHLSIRNAHFRDVTTDGVKQLFDEAVGIFQDRDRTRRALGLDGHQPSATIIDSLNEMIDDYRETFQSLGMTDEQAREWALSQAGPLFEQNFGGLAAEIATAFESFAPRISNIGKEAQLAALEKDIAPEARRAAFEKFAWQVVDKVDHDFLLPDCVAIALTDEGPRPASLAGADDTNAIIMPLSSERLIVGTSDRAHFFPADVNRTMAACSWDFFVAPTSDPIFVELQADVRAISKQFFQDMIEQVTSEYD